MRATLTIELSCPFGWKGEGEGPIEPGLWGAGSAWPFDPGFLRVSADGGDRAKSYLVTPLTLTLKALITDTILLEDSAST